MMVAKTSEAGIINGCRGSKVIIGDSSWVLPVCETYEVLELDLMTLEIRSIGAETIYGVPVNVMGTAQVKVLTTRMRRQNIATGQVCSRRRLRLLSPDSDPRPFRWWLTSRGRCTTTRSSSGSRASRTSL
jgi:hypothetical protein